MKSILGSISLAALTLCAGLSLAVVPAAAQEGAAAPAKEAPKGPSLVVGSQAPAIKVGKWVKGQEVKEFQSGMTYVVEFWATWCGPCRKVIPHMTELAKQHAGKVTFVGVSVWENDEEYVSEVEKFVAKMGEKMDYNVAVDDKFGQGGTMAKTWMEAAGQEGIPAAFIVNAAGQIAWIGHPGQIDQPLEQIVAGKWDMVAAVNESKKQAARAAEDRANQEILQTEGKALQEAFMTGNYGKAASEIETLLGKHPSMSRMLRPVQFMALLRSDETKAYGVARAMIAEFKDDPMVMNQISWTILDTKELKSPDFAVAYDAAMAAAEATKQEDGMILDTLALATFKKGDAAKAVEIATKAIELSRKSLDADTIAEMEARLAEFKKAVK